MGLNLKAGVRAVVIPVSMQVADVDPDMKTIMKSGTKG